MYRRRAAASSLPTAGLPATLALLASTLRLTNHPTLVGDVTSHATAGVCSPGILRARWGNPMGADGNETGAAHAPLGPKQTDRPCRLSVQRVPDRFHRKDPDKPCSI